MSKLTRAKIDKRLQTLPGWELKQGKICKTYRFSTFMRSIQFVNKVARLAEQANHHPNILINYNQVTLRLKTYDKDGLTKKDFRLARQIEAGYGD